MLLYLLGVKCRAGQGIGRESSAAALRIAKRPTARADTNAGAALPDWL
jgi:hypothetical protein